MQRSVSVYRNAMHNTVTIAIPIHKRLQYLPHVLSVVAAQDYPAVELMVSDNGLNGTKVRDLVAKSYPRPYRFRQNTEIVNVAAHINQMIHAAEGEYFVMMGDDDEISPNYASALVAAIERQPSAVMAFSRQEFFSSAGVTLSRSVDVLPAMIPGPEFIPAVWQSYKFGYRSVTTFLGKRACMIECGGFPDFPYGNHIDDGLVVKMALTGDVAFSSQCLFRKMSHDTSMGMAVDIRDLAAATRQFTRFLDEDARIQEFAARRPAEWVRLRECLAGMAWRTYLERWRDIYRTRLPYWKWARAGCAMPLKRAYYKVAIRAMAQQLMRTVAPSGKEPAPKPPNAARDV